MLVLQWVLFALLLLLGGWIVIINWSGAIQRMGSLIPVVGGVLVATSFAFAPVAGLNTYWWIPFLLDLGCLPLLLLTAGYVLWRFVSSRGRPD